MLVLGIAGCFTPSSGDEEGSTSNSSLEAGSTDATLTATTGISASGGPTASSTTTPTTTTPSTTGGSDSTTADSTSTGVPETCDDLDQNQDETDVDCGGSICPPCADGLTCVAGADCESTLCPAGTCLNFCDGPNGGCLLGGSTNDQTVYVYNPNDLSLATSFSGIGSIQSVAAGPDGRIYAGTSGEVMAIDVSDGSTTTLGSGVLSGPMYGTTVSDDGMIYNSGSGMVDVRVMELDGTDAGIVDVLVGTNLRSNTFGPLGDFYLSAFGTANVEHWDPGFINAGTFTGGGMTSPFGIATRSDGTVLVMSQNDAAFYVFTSSGTFVGSVSVNCTGQIRNAATDASDRLYVGCQGSNRIAVFDTDNNEIDSIVITSPSGVGIMTFWPGAAP